MTFSQIVLSQSNVLLRHRQIRVAEGSLEMEGTCPISQVVDREGVS